MRISWERGDIKAIRSLKLVTGALSCLIVGCAQLGLEGGQDSAPIESRNVGEVPLGENVSVAEPTAIAGEEGNTDSVVNISPLAEDGVGALEPIAEPEESSKLANKTPAATQPNAATQHLLSDAQAAFVKGDLAAAESVTNRGLRIAPKDPALWLQLAKIRLGQGEYLEAISLSERAQVLAVDNPAAKVDALQIIATAYESRGDSERAQLAREKARALSGELGTH